MHCCTLFAAPRRSARCLFLNGDDEEDNDANKSGISSTRDTSACFQRAPDRNQGAKFTDAVVGVADDSNSARDDELGAVGLQKCSRGMRALSVFPRSCPYRYEQRERAEIAGLKLAPSAERSIVGVCQIFERMDIPSIHVISYRLVKRRGAQITVIIIIVHRAPRKSGCRNLRGTRLKKYMNEPHVSRRHVAPAEIRGGHARVKMTTYKSLVRRICVIVRNFLQSWGNCVPSPRAIIQ